MEHKKAKFIGKYYGRGYDKDYIFMEYEYKGEKYEVYINTAKGNEPLSWQHKNAQARIDKMIDIVNKLFEDKKYQDWCLEIWGDGDELEKLKSIYKGKNINVTVKEINLESQEFKNNVEQFDLLIRNTNDVSQILTIEEVVIANYEEIIKKQ